VNINNKTTKKLEEGGRVVIHGMAAENKNRGGTEVDLRSSISENEYFK
jgi:hypothetical protein